MIRLKQVFELDFKKMSEIMLVKDFLPYIQNKQIIKIVGRRECLYCNVKSRLRSEKLLNEEIYQVTSNFFDEVVIILK